MAQNVEVATQLLDSLGWKDTNGDGIREGADRKNIVLTLLTRGDVPARFGDEMVAANLKAVARQHGEGVDNATWIAAKDAMDYDIVFFRATPWGTLMHASHGSGYFDSRRTGAGVLHNLSAMVS